MRGGLQAEALDAGQAMFQERAELLHQVVGLRDLRAVAQAHGRFMY